MLRFLIVFVFIALNGVNGTPAESVDYSDESLLFDAPQVFELEGGIACTLCEDVMKIVHAFLQKPDNQKYIIDLMEKGCQYLPVFKDKCLSLVKEYGTIVIDLAVSYINPSLCKTFHICSAGQEVMTYKDNCKVCQLGMGVIYDTMHDPELPHWLKQYTTDMCMVYLGSSNMCVAMADEIVGNLRPVVDEIRRSDFFLNVCAEAEICTK